MTTPARFPKTARVRSRVDYARVFAAARRIHQPLLALHAACLPADAAPAARLGLAVSRKVDAHAVGRNRMKRVLRETFRRLRPGLAPGDYVVVAKPDAARAGNAALAAALVAALQRAGALPAAERVGTMRVHPPSHDPGRRRVRPDPSLPA